MNKFFIFFFFIFSYNYTSPPKLTIIFVIDQFSNHYLLKLKPYLKGAFNIFTHYGIYYDNACHPHGQPATATGHATLNTGVVARDHGIIGNSFFDKEGRFTKFGSDDSKRVFSEKGLYNWGRSFKDILVDGISDQFALNSESGVSNKVFSLSLKARAAIAMGGYKAKSLWFDSLSGNFTSSQAFFNKLPEWVENFNSNLKKKKRVKWNLFFDKRSRAYKFPYINNYNYSVDNFKLIGRPIELNSGDKESINIALKTPFGNQMLLDFAKRCLKENFKGDGNFLLWISLSSLDMLGHTYGPDSLEVIDLIYHLDRQMKDFMNYVENNIYKNSLFILTADHGVAPIPEIMEHKGILFAKRLIYPEIVKKINGIIKNRFGLSNVIIAFKASQIFLDKFKFDNLNEKLKVDIFNLIKTELKRFPQVKNVWTSKELVNKTFEPYQVEQFYKNQICDSRSGQLIYQTEPYCFITKYSKGTKHHTPYNYDTNVPLMFYRKHTFKGERISKKVYTPQLAPTLSYIFDIPRPSAAVFDILPGIINYRNDFVKK